MKALKISRNDDIGVKWNDLPTIGLIGKNILIFPGNIASSRNFSLTFFYLIYLNSFHCKNLSQTHP